MEFSLLPTGSQSMRLSQLSHRNDAVAMRVDDAVPLFEISIFSMTRVTINADHESLELGSASLFVGPVVHQEGSITDVAHPI